MLPPQSLVPLLPSEHIFYKSYNKCSKLLPKKHQACRSRLNSITLVQFSHHTFNLLKPTDYVMHHQFNIQQLYALPTLYLCVLYLSENKQQLVPLTS